LRICRVLRFRAVGHGSVLPAGLPVCSGGRARSLNGSCLEGNVICTSLHRGIEHSYDSGLVCVQTEGGVTTALPGLGTLLAATEAAPFPTRAHLKFSEERTA
jgi:hypothetical protein